MPSDRSPLFVTFSRTSLVFLTRPSCTWGAPQVQCRPAALMGRKRNDNEGGRPSVLAARNLQHQHPHALRGGTARFSTATEEIMQQIPDHSLLAWQDVWRYPERLEPSTTSPVPRPEIPLFACRVYGVSASFFAPSLGEYDEGGKINAISHRDFVRRLGVPHLRTPEYTPTPLGIRTRLLVVPLELSLPNAVTYWNGPSSE